jgi:hypothetical protein
MTVAKVLSIQRSANCNQVARAFNPGGLQSFVFLPLHLPLYLRVPICSWKHLETRRGFYLHVSTMTLNA